MMTRSIWTLALFLLVPLTHAFAAVAIETGPRVRREVLSAPATIATR
jgi:hypothetical protein